MLHDVAEAGPGHQIQTAKKSLAPRLLASVAHPPSLCEFPAGTAVLKGSWDLVTEVIRKVAIVIITCNPH